MAWFVATVADVVVETPTARTLVLDVPGWPGHRAGQHVDLQLRAEDGYTARRSYSIASAPGAERVSLTVQRLDDGEVSPYLCDVVEPGDALEVRGPLGGWFVWPLPGRDARPTVLFGGGSGVVPLVAMARERRRSGGRAPMRLVYSVRSPGEVLYAGELAGELADGADGLAVDLVYTRQAPPGRPRRTARRRGRPCRGSSAGGGARALRVRAHGLRRGRRGRPRRRRARRARHQDRAVRPVGRRIVDETWVDGNAAAGALAEVFAAELTTAEGRCAGCGWVAVLARARVFDHAPGIVLRCTACDGVLLRLVRLPDRAVLDLRGLAHVEVRLPPTG